MSEHRIPHARAHARAHAHAHARARAHAHAHARRADKQKGGRGGEEGYGCVDAVGGDEELPVLLEKARTKREGSVLPARMLEYNRHGQVFACLRDYCAGTIGRHSRTQAPYTS
jgi:hypothetical protein